MKLSLLTWLVTLLAIVPSPAAEKKAAKKNAPADPSQRPATGNGSVRLTGAELKTATHAFKQTPQGELKLYFHFPPGWQASDARPAMIFFFGGGWRGGTAAQFFPQADYFAARGLVTVRADYRILNVHRTTPDKCIEDAKSAVRWLRGHAKEFGVDPRKVIASGGSAGGHLAAAVAMVPGFDSPADDLKISCVPDALVLFNPALNLPEHSVKGADGVELGPKFWPTPFLKRGAPPAVIFFGTSDGMWPQGKEYVGKATALGSRAELWTAADQPHGFFNRQPWTAATAIQADRFLASLGYLQGEPTLKPADDKAALKRVE